MGVSIDENGDATCSLCGGRAEQSGGMWACRACQPDLFSPGLGDMIEMGLSSIGITKERVQRVANAVGIKDCGCGKRQAAANKLGTYLGMPPGSTAEG